MWRVVFGPSARIMLPLGSSYLRGGMILALGWSWLHVNAQLGTTRLPETTLFWLQKAKYDHNTDKISKLRPKKHQVLSQFLYFCFDNKLFSTFVICSCVGLQGHRSVTSVKLSRAVGLPYLKILLVNASYLLTLLLGSSSFHVNGPLGSGN